MVGQAYLAIAGSVIMHVSWNLLVRHQGAKNRMLWWALVAHCVLLGPWALYSLVTEAHWHWTLVLSLAVSATSNVMYFLALNRAYEHAPVALVYPIVRSSPLLIALWSVLFFGESLNLGAWRAISISIVGLGLLAATAWRSGSLSALPWALLAALSTSLYSLSDKAATGYLPSFGALLGFVTIGYFLSLVALTLQMYRKEGRWRPENMPAMPYMLIAGISIGLAYALVIHAMRTLPAALVVAFTNAGIVVAGILSMSLFQERAQWRTRLVGIMVICIGLGFLATNR